MLPFEIAAMKNNLKYRTLSKDSEYRVNSLIVDTLSAYESVRLFGNINSEKSVLTSRVDDFGKAYMRYQTSFIFVDFSAKLTGILMFLIGALLGYKLFLDGQISSTSLIIVITYLISITGGTIGLIFSIRNLLQSLPIAEDFFQILDEKKEIVEPSVPASMESPRGDIHFNNVSFKYDKSGDLPTLNSIDLDIKAGQNVALVGPSGGGKSTITKLLLRYYLPTQGIISIDNININDLGTQKVNEFCGVVPQEPVLFNRTLKFNIGYALGSDEKVIEENIDRIIDAAKRAMIHEFIMSLPEKYDTIVGERGVKLSGGQKQRVAIARVLLKKPKIVIFDEATSMLDSESEGAIQKAFKELVKNTTTIIIAHRLSTIKNVDKIFVIDKGKLVEQGTHTELIEENKIYAKLWAMQSSGFKK
jgi:ATP-binding cassette subfamily B protein